MSSTAMEDSAFDRVVRAPIDEPIQADRETLRFTRTWHQFPPVADALTYDGVNLGELMEVTLLHKVLPHMLEQFPHADGQ